MIRKVLALTLLGMLLSTGAALAHPLGNFSVNHYDGLHVYPDRVAVTSVVDIAEIPTLQEGSFDPTRECAALTGSLRSTVDGKTLAFQVLTAGIEHPTGQGNLATTRITCSSTAPVEITGMVALTSLCTAV
ncbi:hypothetical protein ACFQ1S_43315 [Kibdelosporangium lantanae]|uniref:Neocarzinostatin family protein n=1 Tax=Kibdelosporangium lantanae TaxID=1497396 RepID=A0ABW3MMW9_9PSEU